MKNNLNAILMVVSALLIILVIALWKQNSKLKEQISPFETPQSVENELELLQGQLNQLLELQEEF